jgi:hypothetical protein
MDVNPTVEAVKRSGDGWSRWDEIHRRREEKKCSNLGKLK